MSSLLRRGAVTALLASSLALSSCATIVGTAVSPITGGVDLCHESLERHQWYRAPFVFLGGAVSGPFVALYNGVRLDISVFQSIPIYWNRYPEIFTPFRMLGH